MLFRSQILAGLISDEDRRSSQRVPGLGDIPLLSRLFGSQTDNRVKSEIVLLITPRIVRNISRPEGLMAELPVGTDSLPGAPPLRIGAARPGSLSLSGADAGNAAAETPASPFSVGLEMAPEVRAGAELEVRLSLPKEQIGRAHV